MAERPPTASRADELIEDFRLACISRAIDDREISMQKQSRVFFQISGAGHEALGLALARHLRPGYDWFFPYYRDQALVLGLGVTPKDILLQAVGSAEDPLQRWSPDAQPLGQHGRSTSSRSRARPGSQCIPAVGCAEAARYIVRRPELGLPGPRRRADLRQPGRGRLQRGRVLGEPQHGLQPAPARALRGAGQRLRHLGADDGPAARRRWPSWWPASAASTSTGSTAPTTSACGTRRQGRSSTTSGPASGPRCCTATSCGPYSHSAADTQTKYRSADELADEARRDPIDRMERVLVDARGAHRRRGRRASGPRPRRSWPRRPPRPWPRRGPTRPRSPSRSTCCPTCRTRRPTYEGGDPVPLGRGHQAHAARADGGRRADPGVRRGRGRRPRGRAQQRRGQGRGVRHHPRAAAGLRPGPLLQHAAVGGQHRRPGRRPGHPGPAAGARDPVLRLHLAGHDPDQERGGHHPLALERGASPARWSSGCRSAAT